MYESMEHAVGGQTKLGPIVKFPPDTVIADIYPIFKAQM